MIKNIDALLNKHKENGDFVKFYRNFNGVDANVFGFIISVSDDLILLQIIVDFDVDGFVIIRKKDIIKIDTGMHTKVHKKILISEGVIAKNQKFEMPVSLESWETIFRDIRKLDYHVIAEEEEDEEHGFTIGPILRITKNAVTVFYYNPEGFYERKVSVSYANITTVRFGDRYSTIFRKYLKEKK